ncbi:MAG: helix-hairpin-helix domain-containing protein [Anaerolineales bacterium]
MLILTGILIAGVIWLVASPPRGEPVTLLPPPTPAPVVVHVTGAVAEPGVYELPVDSRVQDALDAAGGALPEADTSGLNLAARLADGSQIRVGTLPSTTQDASPSAIITPTSIPDSSAPPGTPDAGAIVNINTATQRELETLPGIGPVTAQKIIAYRKENGDFETIENIVNVSGIGPATFDKIKDRITVGK